MARTPTVHLYLALAPIASTFVTPATLVEVAAPTRVGHVEDGVRCALAAAGWLVKDHSPDSNPDFSRCTGKGTAGTAFLYTVRQEPPMPAKTTSKRPATSVKPTSMSVAVPSSTGPGLSWVNVTIAPERVSRYGDAFCCLCSESTVQDPLPAYTWGCKGLDGAVEACSAHVHAALADAMEEAGGPVLCSCGSNPTAVLKQVGCPKCNPTFWTNSNGKPAGHPR
jgi:hypothetical protein